MSQRQIRRRPNRFYVFGVEKSVLALFGLWSSVFGLRSSVFGLLLLCRHTPWSRSSVCRHSPWVSSGVRVFKESKFSPGSEFSEGPKSYFRDTPGKIYNSGHKERNRYLLELQVWRPLKFRSESEIRPKTSVKSAVPLAYWPHQEGNNTVGDIPNTSNEV